ncbi:hypothetical protein OFB80_35310, partial [Escherichia coli]|nr:hypothetical protein [Escherichia coli]
DAPEHVTMRAARLTRWTSFGLSGALFDAHRLRRCQPPVNGCFFATDSSSSTPTRALRPRKKIHHTLTR